MHRQWRIELATLIYCLAGTFHAGSGQTSGPLPSITNTPIVAGSKLITGTALPGSDIFVCVGSEFPPVAAPCHAGSPAAKVLTGGSSSTKTGDNYAFSATLNTPLAYGEYVYVTEVLGRNKPIVSQMSSVAPSVDKPNILGNLSAGAKRIQVFGAPDSKVFVCKASTPIPKPLPDCSAGGMLPLIAGAPPSRVPSVKISPGNSIEVNLQDGVASGSSIYLAQVSGNQPAILSEPVTVGPSTAPLSILGPLVAGSTEVKGDRDPLGTLFVCVSDKAPGSSPQDCSKGSMQALLGAAVGGVTQSAPSLPPAVGPAFEAHLVTPLTSGKSVYLAQVIDGVTTFSEPVTVAASTAYLSILGPVIGGTTTIVGTGDQTGRIFVCVSATTPASPPPDCSANGSALPLSGGPWVVPGLPAPGAIGNAKTFIANFSSGLAAGSSVYLSQIIENNPATFSPVVTVQPVVHEREHTDFVGGTLLSANGSNYSQGNIFLALNYDRAIYRPGYYSHYREDRKTKTPPDKASKDPKTKCPADDTPGSCPTRAPGLNFFFQGRLTTIPVNASQTVTTPAATGTATTGTSTTTTPTVSSFLAAQKAAQFGGGGYMPFVFGRSPNPLRLKVNDPLRKNSDTNSVFYLGPVARFGFSTPSGSPSGSSSTTSGAGTTTTTTTALGTSSSASGQLYNFWFAGARIATADIEPGSLHTRHYFDIGVGKYSNLQSLVCNPRKAPINNPSCLTQSATMPVGATNCSPLTTMTGTTTTTSFLCQPVNPALESRTTLYRLAFEGYLEIPSTSSASFILGMSANTAMTAFSRRANLDSNNKAPEDIEFLIAYKFDITKLFSAAKLIGQ